MANYQIIDKACKSCGSNPARYEEVQHGYFRGACDKCFSAQRKAKWDQCTAECRELSRHKTIDRACRKCQARPARYGFKPGYPDNYDVVCMSCKAKRSANRRASEPPPTEAEIGERNRKAKIFRLNLKRTVIEAYGGECYCCHLRDLRFLTVDHIDGKGAEHRKQERIMSGVHTYRWIKKNNFPVGMFRVACFNCNCAAYANGNVCPHQESRLALVA